MKISTAFQALLRITSQRGRRLAGIGITLVWIAFYLIFVAGWLIHPAHLYYELDGHYFEWTVISRAQWSSLLDFIVIDPLQGLVTLKMPENPWGHLGSLPLLWDADGTLRHIVSYTIYWLEFAAATYVLARVIGFSSSVAQAGTQLWLMLVFPPFSLIIGFSVWAALIPIQIQTLAAGNLFVALFIILGRRTAWVNLTIAACLLSTAVFVYFISPLRAVAVAPGFGFLVALACLFDLSRSSLVWKLGTLAMAVAIGLALHVPDYYGAMFGHSPRVWDGAEFVLGDVRGQFDKMDAFYCQMGMFCSTHIFKFLLFYGSMLLAGLRLISRRQRERLPRGVGLTVIGGALYYVLLVSVYSLPYVVQLPFYSKFPSPLYVYNPLFPVFCLIVAHFWWIVFDSVLQTTRTYCIRVRDKWWHRGALTAGSARSVATDGGSVAVAAEAAGRESAFLILLVPMLAFYLCWGSLSLRWAVNSLKTGQPVMRSLRAEPAKTPIIRYLERHIGIAPGSRFNGVVASYLGTAYGPISALVGPQSSVFQPSYLDVMQYLTKEHGNTYMFQDLWGFGIPTLEEYGHFVSPGNVRVFIDLLSEPPDFQKLHSVVFTYRPTVRILKGLGTRYLISDVALEDPELQFVMEEEATERVLSLPELKDELAAGRIRIPVSRSADKDSGATVPDDQAVLNAASRGDVDALRRLHQSGHNLKLGDDALLLAAAANGRVNIIRYLHENGISNPATRGQQLIEISPEKSKSAVIDYLVNSAGVRLDSIDIAHHRGVPLYLYEIRRPNLASYSPVKVDVIADASEAMRRMREDDFSMDREVIVQDALDGPFTPIDASAMYFDKNSVRVTAQSRGKSLLLLPVQFSRCWQATNVADGTLARVQMVRANVAQSVIEFEGNIEIRLKFNLGFGAGTACRKRDIEELRAMHILDGRNAWPLPQGKEPYALSHGARLAQ